MIVFNHISVVFFYTQSIHIFFCTQLTVLCIYLIQTKSLRFFSRKFNPSKIYFLIFSHDFYQAISKINCVRKYRTRFPLYILDHAWDRYGIPAGEGPLCPYEGGGVLPASCAIISQGLFKRSESVAVNQVEYPTRRFGPQEVVRGYGKLLWIRGLCKVVMCFSF